MGGFFFSAPSNSEHVTVYNLDGQEVNHRNPGIDNSFSIAVHQTDCLNISYGTSGMTRSSRAFRSTRQTTSLSPIVLGRLFHVFTPSGRLIATSFGWDMDGPTAIAVSPSGKVYASDRTTSESRSSARPNRPHHPRSLCIASPGRRCTWGGSWNAWRTRRNEYGRSVTRGRPLSSTRRIPSPLPGFPQRPSWSSSLTGGQGRRPITRSSA